MFRRRRNQRLDRATIEAHLGPTQIREYYQAVSDNDTMTMNEFHSIVIGLESRRTTATIRPQRTARTAVVPRPRVPSEEEE